VPIFVGEKNMSTRVNGVVGAGDFLTRKLGVLTIRTLIPLADGNPFDTNLDGVPGPAAASTNRLRILQLLGSVTQGVMLGPVTSENVANPSTIGFGTNFNAPADVYTFRFVFEHPGAFGDNPADPAQTSWPRSAASLLQGVSVPAPAPGGPTTFELVAANTRNTIVTFSNDVVA
jgi:hypothetical protein